MGDLRFHVASFWSQRVQGKPVETHAVLQQGLLRALQASSASAQGESLVAQGPCWPLALPLPAGRMFFYWKVGCFGSGQDMKASREPAPVPPHARQRLRCRLQPSPSCLHRLPVAAATGIGPAPPPAAAQESEGLAATRWRGGRALRAAETLLFPLIRQGSPRVRWVSATGGFGFTAPWCQQGCGRAQRAQPPSPAAEILPTPSC